MASSVGVWVARGLSHVDVFFIGEFSIKISPFNVNLMELEVKARSESEDSTEQCESRNRCVRIKIVNSLYLGKTLCN